MSRFPRAASAALASAFLVVLAALPATAGSPYEGWRGQRATPAPAPAYVGGYSDRRPLDGSYRAPPPTPIWTGLYAGGHLGGAWGSATPNGLSSAALDTDGFTGGLHAGYNIQIDRFLAGFEVDLGWTDAAGSAGYAGGRSAAAELDWLSSARVRLGYTFGDVMVYGTGGLAIADLNLRTTAGGITSNTSEIMTGFALGGGVEMKLNRNVSARLEALHYRFGDERFGTAAGVLSVDQEVTTVRAGLSLHLN